MEVCLYMVLGVLIYMLGEGKVKLPSITNFLHELQRKRYEDVEENVTNTHEEELKNTPEIPVERESEWEKEYDLRIAGLREELENIHSSKTPPNFFDYDEVEMLKAREKNVEIITDTWEKEQEERILR